jgi:hypothetical protein
MDNIGANNFGVFRVKNYDFTPKNLIFPIAEGGAKMFGVSRVKNHDFTIRIRRQIEPRSYAFLHKPSLLVFPSFRLRAYIL